MAASMFLRNSFASGTTPTGPWSAGRGGRRAASAGRWGNLAVLLGIIESEGGAAADWYVFDDRVKFSLDTWNWDSKEPHNERTHVKAGATWAINKLVFVNGGVDNILNVDRRAGFVGVGLRFDDDDMKYLMGSVPVPR